MIDIYEIDNLNKNNSFISSILDNEYDLLRPIFDEYEKNTGYIIDEYSDLIIQSNNIDILLNLLNRKDNKIFLKYYIILKRIKENNFSIGFYGD